MNNIKIKNSFKMVTLCSTAIFLLSCKPIGGQKGVITIENHSPNAVSDVTANYVSSKRADFIGHIQAAGTLHYKIKYSDAENAINISYLDDEQKRRTILAVPYAAKYDKRHYKVQIK